MKSLGAKAAPIAQRRNSTFGERPNSFPEKGTGPRLSNSGRDSSNSDDFTFGQMKTDGMAAQSGLLRFQELMGELRDVMEETDSKVHSMFKENKRLQKLLTQALQPGASSGWTSATSLQPLSSLLTEPRVAALSVPNVKLAVPGFDLRQSTPQSSTTSVIQRSPRGVVQPQSPPAASPYTSAAEAVEILSDAGEVAVKAEEEGMSSMAVAFLGDSDRSSDDISEEEAEVGEEEACVFPEWVVPNNGELGTEEANDRKFFDSSGRDGMDVSTTNTDMYTFEAKGRCMLHPMGGFRMSVDLLSFVFLIVQMWVTSYTLAFCGTSGKPEPSIFALIDNVITFFFAVEMVFNFNTGFMNGDDVIFDRLEITKNYLSGWFLPDFFTTVPLSALDNAGWVSGYGRLGKTLKIGRFMRYMRTIRMVRLMKSMRSSSKVFSHPLLVPCLTWVSFVTLVHVHGCILRALQPGTSRNEDNYTEFFSQTFSAFVYGHPLDSSIASIQILDIVIAHERTAIQLGVVMFLMYKVMVVMEHTAKEDAVVEDVMKYLNSHNVEHKLMATVLQQLKETGEARATKRRFDVWLEEDLPKELHRKVCEELWEEKLRSLAIINHMSTTNVALIPELAMIVREETLAKRAVLYREGDPAIAAYCVLSGSLAVTSSFVSKSIPDFGKHMWVGERALVNSTRGRTTTTTALSTAALMAVPVSEWRQLLFSFGLWRDLEDFCELHYWSGICGRCGTAGDHFADDCPLLKSLTSDSGIWLCCGMDLLCGSLVHGSARLNALRAKSTDKYTALSREVSRSPRVAERRSGQLQRDLKEYLQLLDLQALTPQLEHRGVRNLLQLEEISQLEKETLAAHVSSLEGVDESFSTEAVLAQLEPEVVKAFRMGLVTRAKQELATSEARSQHFTFLSHHKLAAGTEASLLYKELEAGFSEHVRVMFEHPVFLDSEDLRNLEQLQEHLKRSHNVYLLLTEDVLTRPWVLVELATAVAEGVPVLPIEVRKVGNNFKFPDDAFYQDLVSGTLLDKTALEVLESCGISLVQLKDAIRKVFKRISLPYYPHGSVAVRSAQVQRFLKESSLRTDAARQDGTTRKSHFRNSFRISAPS